MESTTLPSAPEIQRYLLTSGWHKGPDGPSGALWTGEHARLAVPNTESADVQLLASVVRRLAQIEHESFRRMAEVIRYVRVDRTSLRASNDALISDSIPLETASIIISSARRMLRTVGTTSRFEKAEISGNFSAIGDEVVSNARMAHTEDGSFIIPIIIPLSEPPEERRPERESALVDIRTSAPEPFERRVTRTFAQSLEAVRQVVVEPGVDPTIKQLHLAIERGVSREFCTSLVRILGQPAVREFGAQFDWAQEISISRRVPRQVTIESDARDLIEKAANKLRSRYIQPRQIFSGKIIELRHISEDPIGTVTISTVRHNRSCEIRVTLRKEQYDQAVEWHKAGQIVLVEGEIQRDGYRRLFVSKLKRIHPLDTLDFSEG